MSTPTFDAPFRETLNDLLAWRRDVRHFKTDPVDRDIVLDCLKTVSIGPSVGNSQPWRFVLVDDQNRLQKLTELFEATNAEALSDFAGDSAKLYATLKLAGLKEAPIQLSVFADIHTNVGRGLGSRTMPETKAYSVVGAIHTLWILLRAHGIGMGWVSILPPDAMAELMEVDPTYKFIGHLCIGYPQEQTLTPELVKAGWQDRLPFDEFIIER
ncbi:5,6-dimethylbenzimidazole synthase [Kordiimonas sp. SCSIO 12610]|uniref:5,6-dimethylbenzimidazole synthase n=1 Tax=Kordiimonas sp. SCSIO 12610 TaxID=2829597 RepID=UPI00210B9729|nr:5,6-dimethylbenzimidazole synthase [Kordiimonas sp. SCSIO 12610]UTW55934.1 5,6-dimethylbenzimidazole synthase [Kordiimonas sp. SCSIO 12610]